MSYFGHGVFWLFMSVPFSLFGYFGLSAPMHLDSTSLLTAKLTQKLESNTMPNEMMNLRQTIGQKIIIDIRYFCPDIKHTCVEYKTTLTPALEDLLIRIKPSGLILFSVNIIDSKQVLTLNYDIQNFAKLNDLPPFFIAIDQEGGRVSRLVGNDFPAFSGNMAIGASYGKFGEHYAKKVGVAIGQQLALLGINLNFAPSVDVNSNPENPIINVRSFSQSPEVVASLGNAFLPALQSQNVIGALKHFPGHGDTLLDSHVGLPVVEHDRSTINSIDLLPFKQIIDKQSRLGSTNAVAMIMTAHIQYPKLDNSTLLNKHGKEIIVPATLSKKILKDVLRDELNFDGIVVSDAMDMAGISQFFNQKTALKQSFLAGVDIALMPYILKTKADVDALDEILKTLAEEAMKDTILNKALLVSKGRIDKVKSLYHLNKLLEEPIDLRINGMQKYISEQPHRALAKSLALNSITEIKNEISTEQLNNVSRIVAVMPDRLRCMGLEKALNKAFNTALSETNAVLNPELEERLHCFSLLSDDLKVAGENIAQLLLNGLVGGDDSEKDSSSLLPYIKVSTLQNKGVLLIVGDISPDLAFYETKGAEEITWNTRNSKLEQLAFLEKVEESAQSDSIHSLFVAMRSPYVVARKQDKYKAIFTTYDYQVDSKSFDSNAFDALSSVLLNNHKTVGQLPVKLEQDSDTP